MRHHKDLPPATVTAFIILLLIALIVTGCVPPDTDTPDPNQDAVIENCDDEIPDEIMCASTENMATDPCENDLVMQGCISSDESKCGFRIGCDYFWCDPCTDDLCFNACEESLCEEAAAQAVATCYPNHETSEKTVAGYRPAGSRSLDEKITLLLEDLADL